MPEDERERVGQVLEPIAGMKMEAGCSCSRPAPYHKLSDKSCPTNRLFLASETEST